MIGLLAGRSYAAQPGEAYVNSVGMRFVRVEAGTFRMGETAAPVPDDLTQPLTYYSRAALRKLYPVGDPSRFKLWIDHARFGDFDERPIRQVRISKPLLMGVHEVTNAQYEQFDPTHRHLRGKSGFSKQDNEAVIFVSWHEATAFCDWLSKKEGRPYRLPTEAEWEYAARAGTTTLYSTGNSLPPEFHKNAKNTAFDKPADMVSLATGKTPPNAWGLVDIHGNVEEWCWDWYGPYDPADRTDPVGRAGGDFKVIRGGSYGTPLYYLRSANRLGLPPDTRTLLTGFRVVIGEMPSTKPLPTPGPQLFQQNVSQRPAPPSKADPDRPYFRGPLKYVNIPRESHGPIYSHHNHFAAITECPNGDLLASWYTCVQERGRELAVAISRLRHGAREWEPASLFWNVPDRNDHCPVLWHDGKGTLYHFNGLGPGALWSPLAIVMRTSTDNGATWSKASYAEPEFTHHTSVVEAVIRTRDGSLAMPADQGGNLWLSRDEGKSWSRAAGRMAGVHPAVVELKDGRLMALGRAAPIDGWMPMSISDDMGKTWKYSPSVFPPITGGQRAVLLRLKEGSILFASFAKDVRRFEPDAKGQVSRYVTNMFAAVSFDEGKTWPVRRVISDNQPDHAVFTMDQGRVRMSPIRSEPLGYLSVCQTQDGVVHLLSSINHYAFNLAWLKQGQPDAPLEPQPAALSSKKALTRVYPSSQFQGRSNPDWHHIPGGAAPPRWSNDRVGDYGTLDPDKGVTIEARVEVSGGDGGTRGFDLETYVVSGPRYLNRYWLTITPSAVYYWYANALRKIADGLENAGAPHTYRMAIRPDTAVQIYRDGKLLATMSAELGPQQAQASRGSHMEWGAGQAGISAKVDHIAYDLGGAFRP
jgi:formylglycine-generating enzyme required for sulfatase activity